MVEPLTLVKRLRFQSAVRYKQRPIGTYPKSSPKELKTCHTKTGRISVPAPRRRVLQAASSRGGPATTRRPAAKRSLQSVLPTSSRPSVLDTLRIAGRLVVVTPDSNEFR